MVAGESGTERRRGGRIAAAVADSRAGAVVGWRGREMAVGCARMMGRDRAAAARGPLCAIYGAERGKF